MKRDSKWDRKPSVEEKGDAAGKEEKANSEKNETEKAPEENKETVECMLYSEFPDYRDSPLLGM